MKTWWFSKICLFSPSWAGGTCPTPVELCEGQSCPADMQCVRSGPTAPSVCQCQPERLDECAGIIPSFLILRVGSTARISSCRVCFYFCKLKLSLVIVVTFSITFCEPAGQTSLSFSGNSYIKYRVTESSQSGEMRLGLRIRTLQRRGVIMFTRVNPCTMLKVSTVTS